MLNRLMFGDKREKFFHLRIIHTLELTQVEE